jgi:hypothetical protein
MQSNPIDTFVKKIVTVKDDLDEVLLDGVSALSTAQFEVEEWKATAKVRRDKLKRLLFDLDTIASEHWNDPALQVRALKSVIDDARSERG